MHVRQTEKKMNINEQPIAVFDSGIGGVSVLRELVRLMPNENIIYYGDSKNAPYGEKSLDEVRKLTLSAVEKFLGMGCKALVVACNTATAAAVRLLRGMYPSLPIVGIEPAIKPAVLYGETKLGKTDGSSTVLVMATPVTLSQDKFARLTEEYRNRANIMPLPCPHLAELIEKGDPDSPEIKEYLEKLLSPYKYIDSIVLGCTHYPFVAGHICEILPNAAVFDGGYGTAKEAKRRIEAAGLANTPNKKGKVTFMSSKSGETTELYRRFLTF